MDHFTKPNIFDIPGPDIPKHPLIKCIDINDWCQCKDFQNIFILGSDMKLFFCSSSKCNRWYAISNTFGNINQHMLHFYYGLFRYILIHHYQKNAELDENETDIINQDNVIDNINISPEVDHVICAKYKAMILKTGKTFSLVANKDMKSVLHFLGTRQQLSDQCQIIAEKVKKE